jgi:pilus assembly protein Flp/PilA
LHQGVKDGEHRARERKGDTMLLRVYTAVTSRWAALKTRASEEAGATAVEYALMVALIAVVIIAAVAFVGKSASSQFHSVGTCINDTTAC